MRRGPAYLRDAQPASRGRPDKESVVNLARKYQPMPTRQKKSLPPKLPTPRALTTVRVKPAENFAIFDSTDRPQLLCRREDDQSILICFNYAGPNHKDLSRS